MRHLAMSKIVTAAAAIVCLSILSGCWHHRRDPAYVERVDVRVDHPHDEHHGEHHEERHDR